MKSPQRRFSIILALSFLIHVILLLIWVSQSLTAEKQEPKQDKTISVKIKSKNVKEKEQQKKLEPKKEEKEEKKQKEKEKPKKEEKQEKPSEPENELSHAPLSNSDKFASNNQTDKTEKKLVMGADVRKEAQKKAQKKEVDRESKPSSPKDIVKEIKAKDQKQTESAKNKLIEGKETLKAVADSKQKIAMPSSETEQTSEKVETLEAIELPTYMDDFGGEYEIVEGEEANETDAKTDVQNEMMGNVKMLGDPELQEVFGEQPFSEERSKEIQMVNVFLERMNKQVISIWDNPYQGSHMYRGVAKLELSVDGDVIDAFIYRSSGIEELDESVIDAIYAVGKFQVPENKVIAERYSNLKFYFSSIEEERDKLPFEIDDE